MKTTVEWLEHMLSIILNEEQLKQIAYTIKQAKEIEKQQQGYSLEDLKEAYGMGRSNYTIKAFNEKFNK